MAYPEHRDRERFDAGIPAVIDTITNQMRQLNSEFRRLQAQQILSARAQQSPIIFDAILEGSIIKDPNILDPIIEGDLTLTKGANDATISKTDGSNQINIDGLMEIAQNITGLGEVITHGGVRLVDGDNDVVITKTTDVKELNYTDTKIIAANMECQNLFAAANSVKVGNQTLSEIDGELTLKHNTPRMQLTDSGDAGNAAKGMYGFKDSDDVYLGYLQKVVNTGLIQLRNVAAAEDDPDVRLVISATAKYIGVNKNGFYIGAGGVHIDDIDTVMAGAPADDQLLTAQGIKEFVVTATEDRSMGGFDIINPLEIRYDGTLRPFIRLYRSNASNVNFSPYILLGRDSNDRFSFQNVFNAAGALTETRFTTESSGGVSVAGFGDISFYADEAEKFRIKADGSIMLPVLAGIPGGAANGAIWMEADGLHIYYNGAEKIVAGV